MALLERLAAQRQQAPARLGPTRIFVFPGDALRPLVAGKPRTGRATSPAAQILMAHTGMVQRTLSGLSPSGAPSSRNALL
ncbi:hypothetical protein ACFY64_11345 [Streptomyces collinus]|uniref:hypothetical protein n=1 Tax=Streptomyces collinus TaxID=42684 RepID=UPI00368037C4